MDADRLRAGSRKLDIQRGGGRSFLQAQALNAHIGTVVVFNGSRANVMFRVEGGVHRDGKPHQELFVRLIHGVVLDRDQQVFLRFPRFKGQGAAGVKVVRIAGGRDIACPILDADLSPTGGGKRDPEGHHPGNFIQAGLVNA